YGVIALITPWNYPLSLTMWTIVPALLPGNTLVFKTSEYSTKVGEKIDKLLNGVLPGGVLNTVFGGDDPGKELVKSDIDKLFFTGSVGAGKDIMKNIGIKPLALELGGKDAFIVCEDADIDLAVRGAVWGSMGNCGQVCSAVERIYVNRKISGDFIKKLVEETKKIEKGRDVGNMVNEEQFKKAEEHVKDAVSKGAKVLCGGEGEDLFFEPTVLTDVSRDMKVMSEETFGPVVPVIVVENDEEAINLSNDSKFGLGASIWTRNIERGREIGGKLEVGMIWINDVNLPYEGGDYWGGFKESGLANSESKIMQCLKKKSFIIYRVKEKRVWWYPYE
ncbi:MAG: aldehyde dehydrogenase family protein, partial [archaeon]